MKQWTIKHGVAGMHTKDVALQCKRGLEAAGFTVTLEGFENVNSVMLDTTTLGELRIEEERILNSDRKEFKYCSEKSHAAEKVLIEGERHDTV